MSYDLQIKSRGSASARRPLPEVQAILDEIPGLKRTGGPVTAPYVLRDAVAGDVFLDLSSDAAGVSAIGVTTSFSTEPPAQLYSLCADIAERLGWDVFDPHGNTWYTPRSPRSATSATLDSETVRTLFMVAGAGATIVCGAVWLLLGRQRDPWFVATALGLLLFFGMRLWSYLANRR